MPSSLIGSAVTSSWTKRSCIRRPSWSATSSGSGCLRRSPRPGGSHDFRACAVAARTCGIPDDSPHAARPEAAGRDAGERGIVRIVFARVRRCLTEAPMKTMRLRSLVRYLSMAGSVSGILALVFAIRGDRLDVAKLALVLFVLAALSTLTAYRTREPVEEPDLSDQAADSSNRSSCGTKRRALCR